MKMFDLVPTGSETSTPLFDLHALVAGVRRRMRPWLLVALIGLLAGAALPIVMPGSATAAARIYVVDSDQTDTGEARMQTAVAIMQSSTVADAALRTLGSTMPTRDFIKTYTATSSGVNLVDLTVRAGNPATAVANATAIADAFVADHIGRAQAAADAYTQALQTRVADLRRQLAQLNRPGAAADPATQAQLQAQIDGLTQQTQQATLGAPEVVAGTRVIDAPHSTTRSLKSAMAINGGLGLLVGLMLGLLAALLLTVVGDRPVLRRDVSANLGASVVAQLGRRRLLLPGRPRRSRRDQERVVVELARSVRAESRDVVLVEVGVADVAAELATGIATELASDGGDVVVVDDLPGDTEHVAPEDGSTVRVVGGADHVRGAEHTAARVVGLTSAAPGTTWSGPLLDDSVAFVVVRAAGASTAWLHTVARRLDDAGVEVLGVVLVDPDPRDRSDGTLWTATHPELRARSAPEEARADRVVVATGTAPGTTDDADALPAAAADAVTEPRTESVAAQEVAAQEVAAQEVAAEKAAAEKAGEKAAAEKVAAEKAAAEKAAAEKAAAEKAAAEKVAAEKAAAEKAAAEKAAAEKAAAEKAAAEKAAAEAESPTVRIAAVAGAAMSSESSVFTVVESPTVRIPAVAGLSRKAGSGPASVVPLAVSTAGSDAHADSPTVRIAAVRGAGPSADDRMRPGGEPDHAPGPSGPPQGGPPSPTKGDATTGVTAAKGRSAPKSGPAATTRTGTDQADTAASATAEPAGAEPASDPPKTTRRGTRTKRSTTSTTGTSAKKDGTTRARAGRAGRRAARKDAAAETTANAATAEAQESAAAEEKAPAKPAARPRARKRSTSTRTAAPDGAADSEPFVPVVASTPADHRG
ncbi:hypothetical protein GCM10023403_45440 [Pseudonocardia benzenivorans]